METEDQVDNQSPSQCELELDAIHRKKYSRYYKIALAVTQNPALAEEAVQNVYVEALERKKPPSAFAKNPEAYLGVCVFHEAIRIMQIEKPQGVHFIDLADMEPLAAPERQSEYDEALVEHLKKLLKKMPSEAVQLLALDHVEGLSHQEIAEMMGKSKNAVALALFKLRAELKIRLRLGEGK